jgi:hypothetical protein
VEVRHCYIIRKTNTWKQLQPLLTIKPPKRWLEKAAKDADQSMATASNTDASNSALARMSLRLPRPNANAAATSDKNGNAGQEGASKESLNIQSTRGIQGS